MYSIKPQGCRGQYLEFFSIMDHYQYQINQKPGFYKNKFLKLAVHDPLNWPIVQCGGGDNVGQHGRSRLGEEKDDNNLLCWVLGEVETALGS